MPLSIATQNGINPIVRVSFFEADLTELPIKIREAAKLKKIHGRQPPNWRRGRRLAKSFGGGRARSWNPKASNWMELTLGISSWTQQRSVTVRRFRRQNRLYFIETPPPPKKGPKFGRARSPHLFWFNSAGKKNDLLVESEPIGHWRPRPRYATAAWPCGLTSFVLSFAAPAMRQGGRITSPTGAVERYRIESRGLASTIKEAPRERAPRERSSSGSVIAFFVVWFGSSLCAAVVLLPAPSGSVILPGGGGGSDFGHAPPRSNTFGQPVTTQFNTPLCFVLPLFSCSPLDDFLCAFPLISVVDAIY